MSSLVGMRFDMTITPMANKTSCINFFSTDGDVAFCFTPQIDENEIVCKTRTGGNWGPEQKVGANGIFEVGKKTMVFIDFRPDGFFPVCGDDSSVSIRYEHQIDVNKVTQMNFADFNIESLTISAIPK